MLRAEAARARRGEFRCVLLVGEAGVGKTRLADELCRLERLPSRSARAYSLGTSSAFGLWAEALERHLRALPRTEVAALCDGSEHDLASLLRSVTALVGSASPGARRRGRGCWGP